MDRRWRVAWNLLVKRDLIENNGGYGVEFTITEKGLKVLRLGSWSNCLDYLELKENKKINKEHYDFLFSKYRYKTFWLFFVIAIFGGIYSAYDFIERLNTKEGSQLKQKPIIKSELELSKPHISPLIQKNLDSLHDSKTQPDSLLKK